MPESQSDLNPEDIESIEVLKSGAASSIYGSEESGAVRLAPDCSLRSE